MTRNVICLWYDGTAEAAARFYAETFPDSAVTAIHHSPGDFPGGSHATAKRLVLFWGDEDYTLSETFFKVHERFYRNIQ